MLRVILIAVGAVLLWPAGAVVASRVAAGAPAVLAAATPEFEETLRAMERAVLAGDAEGYLSWVDRGDAVFAMEQKNWAADLALHRPAAFSMEVEGLAVEGDRATGELKMRWRLAREGGEAGPERAVAFPAKFVRGQTPLGHGWLYAGEDWASVEGEGVVVWFPEGWEEAAEGIVGVFPEIAAHVHEGFGIEVEGPQHVKLYPSMEWLQASIYLSYTDPLGGWNEPGESIKLLGDAVRGRRGAALGPMARVVLAHEYGHVATFAYGARATEMPWWVLEGVAELAAERYSRSGRRSVEGMVRAWAAAGSLIEWERLADFRGEAANHGAVVYTQGHHMLGYISERFGRERRNGWLRAMASGASLDEATREALGVSFEELDRGWRESVSAPAEAEPVGAG